jgi:2-oxoisovalerate dehydrogenase E1 component alpha subunit
MLRFLDVDGNLLAATPAAHDQALSLELFRWMLYVQAFDSAALSLQRWGKISFCNPTTGEEAGQIGSACALSDTDWVFPSYRVPGVYLYRKKSPLPLFHQLFGTTEDLSRGRQMPMHFGDAAARFFSVSSPVGTQITQAAGWAYAARLRNDAAIAIAYFGDGATSTNDFHAGLNLAGVLRVPAVFYCSNNQYALSTPLRRQTAAASIATKALAYGIEGVQVDGNDVLAVYTATREAAERCRCGHGPVLIEAVTYRLGPHSSTDNPGFYRAASEEASWRAANPIQRFRRFLERQGWWSSGWEETVRSEQDFALRQSIAIAERSPRPAPETLFQDVYSEPEERLERQCRRMVSSAALKEAHRGDFKFPI